VDNKLANDDSKLNIELKFNSIEDFGPVRVLEQVPSLKRLYEARKRLAELLTKLDGNDDLDRLLQKVIHNTYEELEEIKELSKIEETAE